MLGNQIGTKVGMRSILLLPPNLTCTLDVPPRPHLHGEVKSSPSSTWVLGGAQLRLPNPNPSSPRKLSLEPAWSQMFPCSLQGCELGSQAAHKHQEHWAHRG